MQKMSIQPKLENVAQAIAFFEEILTKAEVPLNIIAEVTVAVDEIFSNIARYSGAATAMLTCEIKENRVKLAFLDDGKKYNPLEREEPDVSASLEERETGGIGIFMVRKMMDLMDYEYLDRLNILVLEKGWQG